MSGFYMIQMLIQIQMLYFSWAQLNFFHVDSDVELN